ncbi:unnamed protein product [Orchesella dallaii]|uniref:Uncharacterized protein n=1 Tax=Orchesella dallaii TaxID=48710 RepID=A0ABP1RQ39_9HEXA
MDKDKTGSMINCLKILPLNLDCCTGTHCDLSDHYARLNSELWLLFVMTVSISVKQVYEMYSSTTLLDYFKQLENIGQWTVVVIVFLASIPIFRVDGNWTVGIYEWEYQTSSVY